jgi:hypothetical protein
MPNITKRGYALAWRLNPFIGSTAAIAETCSLLARHALTYSRYQKDWCDNEYVCNTSAVRARREAAELRLMARIDSLVRDLPMPDEGPWRLIFQGDPRGSAVRLVAPDGREVALDG